MNKAILFETEVNEKLKRITRKVTVIDAPAKEKEHLDFFYEKIGCELIDAVSFDAGELIVDDEGYYKANNPVFEYDLGNGYNVPLVGNIVAYKEVDNLGRTVWFDEKTDVDAMIAVIDILENGVLLGATNE